MLDIMKSFLFVGCNVVPVVMQRNVLILKRCMIKYLGHVICDILSNQFYSVKLTSRFFFFFF